MYIKCMVWYHSDRCHVHCQLMGKSQENHQSWTVERVEKVWQSSNETTWDEILDEYQLYLVTFGKRCLQCRCQHVVLHGNYFFPVGGSVNFMFVKDFNFWLAFLRTDDIRNPQNSKFTFLHESTKRYVLEPPLFSPVLLQRGYSHYPEIPEVSATQPAAWLGGGWLRWTHCMYNLGKTMP